MNRYERVLTKHKWAKQHVDNFHFASIKFRNENHHAIRRENNLKAGSVTYYVESIPTIGPELALLFGDAVHNLRSTLDHLARALADSSGNSFDIKKTSFPIFDTPEGYRNGAGIKINGLRDTCRKILDSIEPYKDGRGHALWQIHQLDVIDKHRMLVAVATVPTGRTMTPSEKSAFTSGKIMFGESAFWAARQHVCAFTNPRIEPLKAGDVLETIAVSEPNENVGFAFDIAISEPEVMEGMVPAWLFLLNVASEILAIIEEFALCI